MPNVTFLRRLPAIAAAGAVLLAAAGAAYAQQSKEEIEKIVREYILKNPEIIQEAIIELRKKQELAEQTARAQALQSHKEQIFRSKRDVVVGNPNGDVTLVEFFDYNCGCCRGFAGELQAVEHDDPNLRIVYLELPILGARSALAARAALAAQRQGAYVEFHQALMASRGYTSPAAIQAIAADLLLDGDQLQHDMADPVFDDTLEHNLAVAGALGIQGTPAFVIGQRLVQGALPRERLAALVAQARDHADR